MNPSDPGAPPPNILVVDDTPANLQLLVNMLKQRGYKVRPVPNGELALRAARASPPDLILLDVTMPGMDGYEVCAQLKADARLRDIPVLFISALNETEDKVRAFQSGGVDYVTKPFQLEEVDARVRTHLALRRHERELQESLDRLRELERLRDSLTHMVVHDMRSPLLALQLTMPLLRRALRPEDRDAIDMLDNADSGVAVLVEMATQMLDVSRMEAGRMTLERRVADLNATVRAALDGCRMLAGTRRLPFSPAGPVEAWCDPDIVRRIVGNLVGNALKFTSPGGEVRVQVAAEGARARVTVTDDGPGIAPENHGRIFEKFGQLEGRQRRQGTGLGLTFARMAVEAHGGEIGVDSALGRGSTFWFTLPVAAP